MKMRPWRICQRLSAVCLLLGPAFADCPATGATYRLADDPTGTVAQLTLMPAREPSAYSDLDLVLTAPGLPAPERMALTASNGYGATYAVPLGPAMTGDSLSIEVFADVAGKLSPYPGTLPQADTPPPDAIFVTDLGQIMYYATAVTPAQVYIPSGMWYLTCP
jgi:hypothetical protein